MDTSAGAIPGRRGAKGNDAVPGARTAFARQRARGRSGPPREMPQMECPICSALIMSTSEEDLSDDLRDHMADQHDIRRKRLDWIYGRR